MVPAFSFNDRELEAKVNHDPQTDKKYIWYLILGVATAEEYREKRHPLHNWAWLKAFAIHKVHTING